MRSRSSYGYCRALAEICALEKFGSHLGLERIRRILRLLGNPQASYKCIIVGGSNGKGSATEMIGSVLSEAGFCVGTYFSPQIEEFPERFRIDGKNAGKQEIAKAYAKVLEVCRRGGIPATFFEVVTAMALLIFQKRNADFAVLEVGLGGRLDATNAAEPVLSALTSISLEHTSVLGNTVEKIAHEKCGIARKGKALVCGFLSKEARAAVEKECRRIGAKPVFCEEEVAVLDVLEKNGRHSFTAAFEGKKYPIALSAPGKFQISNACAALAVCAKIGIERKAIGKGLAKASPAYRFQKISSSPLTFADCAHNPEAAAALSGELARIGGGAGRARAGAIRKRVLLFSAMKDKDYQSVLRALAPQFDALVLCEVPLARCAGLVELFAASRRIYPEILLVKEPKRALDAARKIAENRGLLVVAGSIYLLAELFGKERKIIAQ